jgi:RpiB/LacA/LacB family sugar-phosphate isomerase
MAIREGRAERGVLVCGSGVGASVAACKIPGIRAAICHDAYSAHQGVEHDDMNVLCLGSEIVGPSLARELVERFLAARFVGEGRYLARLVMVEELERLSDG